MAKKVKGQTCYPSTMGNKGIPGGSLPKVSEKKAGPITWSGQGGNKGIPGKKPGSGEGSQWAGTHD